jgi:hypothetical protein
MAKSQKTSTLRASLADARPPSGLGVPAQALWWAAKGDWDRAHTLVQSEDGREAAWVHAYLHRVEGDKSNAAYWYRRAGREPSTAPLDAEWSEIAIGVLGGER